MTDTAATTPDPFSAPAAETSPAPAPTPAETAPASAAAAASAPANPFEPVAQAQVDAAPVPPKPAGPDLTPGTLVAYQWDDPYEGTPKVRAGIVVSAIAATDDQGPQAVVAWLADDTSILPTTDVVVVDTEPATSTAGS